MSEMRMDGPVGETRLDRATQGVLGEGVERVDGRLKVTGRAPYALDHRTGIACACAITATIGHGRVTGFDTDRARAMPGVIDVIVDDPRIPCETGGFSAPVLDRGNDEVGHFGQALGIVVAETFEQARAAAAAVGVSYAPEPGRYDVEPLRHTARPAKGGLFEDVTVGDIDRAMAEAAITLDGTWTTPSHAHAAMEPHAAIAEWRDGRLTVWTSVQILTIATKQLAASLDIEPEAIRIHSPFIGGAFGGKGGLGCEAVFAAIAAERTGRPVKMAASRRQLFHLVFRRTETAQRVRLAAGPDGRLTAFGHDSIVSQRPGRGFFEPVAIGSAGLYAGAARSFTHSIVDLDLAETGAVRSPGEAVGMLAVECAMDEMAERVGMDPVEFRILNDPARDPTHDRPYSSRQLVECLREGARRFGWEGRQQHPGTLREGDWLIGRGVASAIRMNKLRGSSARVRLEAGGRAVVECDMTDIGTGSYTILAQIAAEMLGLPVGAVEVRLGDTAYPGGWGSGGSMGAASAGSAVMMAAGDVVAELARRMDADPATMTLKDGHAIAGNRRIALADLAEAGPIEATGSIAPGEMNQAFDQASYGAHFVEVGVDRVTGEVRVRRVNGVFAAGRILNAATARSQIVGGMIWGIGAALTESLEPDTRFGNFANNDLAEYHVPVNADIPALDVTFLPEADERTNPLKIKGLGELGNVGIGAAVLNAIHDATGIRLRDFPATLDRLLPHMPG